VKITIVIILSLLTLPTLAQEKTGNDLVLLQKNIIYNQLQLLKERQSFNQQQVDQKLSELDQSYEQKSQQLDNRYQAFENNIKKEVLPRWWESLFGLLLITAVLSSGVGFELARRVFKRRLEKIERDISLHFEKSLKEIIEEKPELLAKLLHGLSREERLKQDSRLIIIHDKKDNKLEDNFKNAGFKQKPICKKLSDVKEGGKLKFDNSDFNIIVFDSLDNEDIQAYRDALNPEKIYVAFTDSHYKPRLPETVATPNSKITLYPRTMELLIYQDMQKNRAVPSETV